MVSGLLSDQFKLEMVVPQRPKEAPKISEGIPVSLTVKTLDETKNTIEEIGSVDSTVELEKTVIHQHQTPGQH